ASVKRPSADVSDPFAASVWPLARRSLADCASASRIGMKKQERATAVAAARKTWLRNTGSPPRSFGSAFFRAALGPSVGVHALLEDAAQAGRLRGGRVARDRVIVEAEHARRDFLGEALGALVVVLGERGDLAQVGGHGRGRVRHLREALETLDLDLERPAKG